MAQSTAVGGGEDLRFIFETDIACAECHNKVLLTDPLCLLQIVIPQLDTHQQIVYPPFERANGTYAYDPWFFHSECWDDVESRLLELLEEEGCPAVPDPYAFRTCASCKSGLRLLEPVALVTAGELQRSTRAPNGDHSIHFISYPPVRLYCLSCIRSVNDELLEMWEHISYGGECVQCTYERMWRSGGICMHDPDEEEEEEDE